ncbi:hypothetical protein GCK32_013455 [Trichostrongylus colubriformis]|uniref:Uncharacterized protein n=1 Tax=Trichostrongylus colubriformis TaxID=6319 RepID=A0AAN8ISG5_TRICO
MLLIFTVLAPIIADVGENSKPQLYDECTATKPGKDSTNSTTVLICVPNVKKAFSIINEYWIDGPIWNDRIALKALKEAKKPNSTKADYKIRQEKVFSKGERNETTMVAKVVKTLSEATPWYWMEKRSICPCIPPREVVRRIPPSVYYGCNGIFDKEGSEDVLTVVCLYRTTLKNVLHKYRNIEVKGFN